MTVVRRGRRILIRREAATAVVVLAGPVVERAHRVRPVAAQGLRVAAAAVAGEVINEVFISTLPGVSIKLTSGKIIFKPS